jgi:O-antigen/teichoic acid export membrane protein
VGQVLNIPLTLQPAARFAFYCSALGFPISLIGGALGSVPKAAQRFDLSTRVAIVFSTVGPLLTVALVLLGYGLPGLAVASLILGTAGLVVYYRMARGILGGQRIQLGLDRDILRGLAAFGGWFLLASVGVTILYQLDKVMVGSLLSVAAVTYYVVPGNLANRIQGFLGAATQVVFPASAALFQGGHKDSLARLYRDGTRLTFLLACTLGVPLALFASPFLRYWMGPTYAERSSLVMVLLVATYMLLGLTGMAWGISFGSGRAKVAAVFAIAMALTDVVLFLLLVGKYEINGAAVAYLISAMVGVPLLVV